MAPGSQNGVSPIHYHPDYYLGDGNVTFHVDGTLFRVHRHFFERESQFFAEEFAKAPQEGTSDSSAYRLYNVTIADFSKFLWVWYSPSYRRERKDKDHWLTILQLSTNWQFPDMKKLAVDELQKLDIEPVEKIVTYDRYNIDRSLLLPAFKLLCKRASRMSAEEGEQLKMPIVLGIHEARERAIRSAAESGCLSPTSADADDEELERILNDVFTLNNHATNRQGLQSQVTPNPVPIIKTPKPNLNGTANGNGSSAPGSSTQNDDKQKDADKDKGKAKMSEPEEPTDGGGPSTELSMSVAERTVEPTDGGGPSTELSMSVAERREDLVLLDLYLPTFIQSVMTAVFTYVVFFV